MCERRRCARFSPVRHERHPGQGRLRQEPARPTQRRLSSRRTQDRARRRCPARRVSPAQRGAAFARAVAANRRDASAATKCRRVPRKMLVEQIAAQRLHGGCILKADVHLGLVAKRTFGEVGRADRREHVVHQHQLAVHVDVAARAVRHRSGKAGEREVLVPAAGRRSDRTSACARPSAGSGACDARPGRARPRRPARRAPAPASTARSSDGSLKAWFSI